MVLLMQLSLARKMVRKLNEKGKTVANEKTKGLCLEKNIYFFEHQDFNPKYHLNGSKLHPNKKGSVILVFIFLQYLITHEL